MTTVFLPVIPVCWCLSLDGRPTRIPSKDMSRRDALVAPISATAVAAAGIASIGVACPTQQASAALTGGLAAKLSKKDPAGLRNSVFNVPPSAQVYPDFMRGEWDVTEKFAGYVFPSTSIPKSKVIADIQIPGFQKCSIAAISDIGRELASYRIRIDANSGLEDRKYNLANAIDGHLGYTAVDSIDYDVQSNPNRMSIIFVLNRTRNAERIELFFNARESELVPNPSDENYRVFVCSEYIRQVTFSLSQEFGVARQVVGNYAHFWTWREHPNGEFLTGNVLTAAYLDPQDALFFEEPSKPIVVYSHNLEARKLG